MPYAIIMVIGGIEWDPARDGAEIIGYAGSYPGDLHRLPVVEDLSTFLRLCRKQNAACDYQEVEDQFADGTWRLAR